MLFPLKPESQHVHGAVETLAIGHCTVAQLEFRTFLETFLLFAQPPHMWALEELGDDAAHNYFIGCQIIDCVLCLHLAATNPLALPQPSAWC